MLSMSSMSHVSVKHIKLQSQKSASNVTSAVNSSILSWRARTFDRVIVRKGCLLPRFFSRSLTLPLDPRFLLFFSFPITSTMSQRFTFKSGHGVWRWKENKNSRVYLCKMVGLSCPCSPSEKISGTKSHRRQHTTTNRIHFAAISIQLYAHFHKCTTSTRNTTAQ